MKAYDKKTRRGSRSRGKQNVKEKGKYQKSDGFPVLPSFSDRVREIVPLAVKRHRQRPKKDEWLTVDPRNPKNRIVTLENGQKRIVGKGGALLPLYRDWEKEVGKPIGQQSLKALEMTFA